MQNTAIYVIDWGAWATFSTGLMAVAAALAVGLLQLKISKRQTKILARQAEIQKNQTDISERIAATEESRIRLEMFEKRYEFIETLNAFVRRVRSKRDEWTDEDTAFLEGAKRAEFLFPRSLKGIIDNLWIGGAEYRDAAENLADPDMAKREAARETRKELRASLDASVDEFDQLCDREVRPFDN